MAEIKIRKKKPVWPWILVVIILAILAFLYFYGSMAENDDNEIDETLKHSGPGILSMANAGPNTNGSQFFIVHGADAGLPPNYTIFGMLTAGMDVLDSLANSPVSSGGRGENSSPTERLEIESIEITES